MKCPVALLGVAFLFWTAAVAPLPAAEDAEKYLIELPVAEQFCPPIAGFFNEIVRTMDRVGSRTFRHQPNGGYGLAVVDKVGDANLLHLGADVGWYRVGEPVFAVADGVVRVSEGPPPQEKDKKEAKTKPGRQSGGRLEWRNLVVLEHRLPDEKYVTTIYGHLANERLVKEGDTVRAGQQIGTIGTTRVNGGYNPHLHFGVRDGRIAEVGRMVLPVGGKPTELRIGELREDAIVLSGAEGLPESLRLTINSRTFELHRRDGHVEVAPAILQAIQSPEFAIVGYGLTTKGWLDPIAFLKERGADVSPAPFETVARTRKRGRPARDRVRERAPAVESAE